MPRSIIGELEILPTNSQTARFPNGRSSKKNVKRSRCTWPSYGSLLSASAINHFPLSNVYTMTLLTRSTGWGGLLTKACQLLSSLTQMCIVDDVCSTKSPASPNLPSVEAALLFLE